jgi:hypothetical protein
VQIIRGLDERPVAFGRWSAIRRLPLLPVFLSAFNCCCTIFRNNFRKP